MTFDSTGLLAPQIPHTKFLLDAQERLNKSWDGTITGGGKTYTACAMMKNMGRKFVILCPKLAKPTWEKTLAKFGLKAEVIINYDKLVRGNTPWATFVKTKKNKEEIRAALDWPVNDELPFWLRIKLKFPADWVIICDESHRGKGVESLTAGIFVALKRQNYACHLMSATQAMTPLDMRAFGYLMGLHGLTMKKFRVWARDTAGAQDVGKWNAQYFDSANPASVAKLKTVHNYLFHEMKVASRLVREDFGNIFPDNQIVAEAYDMGAASDKIQGVYDEMEFELQRLEDRTANYREHVFAILTKARRHAELLKVPTMVDMGLDLYAEGKSVVFFVNYVDTIVALNERLAKETHQDLIALIHGAQSYKARCQDIELFNADKKRFTVANMLAGGESISLHDLNGKYPRASIFNPSYRAISVLQALGRIDRAYAMTPVYQRGLLAARTIEEEVAANFTRKHDHLSLINDGDLVPKRVWALTKGLAAEADEVEA